MYLYKINSTCLITVHQSDVYFHPPSENDVIIKRKIVLTFIKSKLFKVFTTLNIAIEFSGGKRSHFQEKISFSSMKIKYFSMVVSTRRHIYRLLFLNIKKYYLFKDLW